MSTPPQADMAETYRAALELVCEALDIPHAKTVGDDEKRTAVLHLRVIDALIAARAVLDGTHSAASTLDYCREQLAKHPAIGYHPAGAPLAYGMYAGCADSRCGHRQGSHWERAEPGGQRTGCAYLGCPCTTYRSPDDAGWISGSMGTGQVADDDQESLIFADEGEYMTAENDE